ncbi:hypothetical protein CAY59_03085 [Vibrio campbellii]|nr:hypothetical protein CAY59_03085 [Vibrio campbellii]
MISQIRKDPSISAEVWNKWLTAGVAGNGDSFPEREIIMLKNEKALAFLLGLYLNKWRSGRDSNPRPPA